MVEAEGTTLQHLKTKTLTLVTIYIHRHDRQWKLSSILHFKTLSDGKQGFIGAKT